VNAWWTRSPLGRAVLGVVLVLSAGIAAGGMQRAGGPAPRVEPLRLGVVGFYNPRLMYLKYQELVDYLTETTGRRWELVIGSSYEETVEGLCSGTLDLAYLGPFTYVQAHARCGALPVVRLRTLGRETYRSLMLVRTDSPIREVSDLGGRRFGFGSPLSTSSHLVPRAILMEAGLAAGKDVECRYFRHHERAARAVLLGEVEACGVRDIVGEKYVGRGLRVLARSDPIPNFPLVVGPGDDGTIRRMIVRALLEVPQKEPAVRARMGCWDRELAGGFLPAADADYDGVRVLARRVFGPRALLLGPGALQCGGGD